MAEELKSEKKARKRKVNKEIEKAEPEPKQTFPVEGFINKWGFIHVSGKVAEAFSAGPFGKNGTDMPITIDFKDERLIISKK